MEIQINVTIGTTPALEALIKALAISEQKAASHTEAVTVAEAASHTEAVTVAEAGSHTEAGGSEQEAVSSEQDTANSEQEVKYDAAYARKVMDETRKRIEGVDYKDNPDAPGRKKYHTQLTNIFKQIATQLGGTEKPSSLDPEQMKKFAQECACIEVSGDKLEINDMPF